MSLRLLMTNLVTWRTQAVVRSPHPIGTLELLEPALALLLVSWVLSDNVW
jgi:hypothetical protein